jgi:hypothetical protein
LISASLRDTGVLDEEPIFELLFACVVASVVVCCVVEVFLSQKQPLVQFMKAL